MKVIGYFADGTSEVLTPEIRVNGASTVATLPKEQTWGKGYEYVEFTDPRAEVYGGTPGYCIYPMHVTNDFALTYFEQHADADLFSELAYIPVIGICVGQESAMIHPLHPVADALIHFSIRRNVYTLSVRFQLDQDDSKQDLIVEGLAMPGADYSAIARAYRKYQMEVNGVTTLQARAAKREAVAYCVEAPEVRIRMGWKPSPTTIFRQTEENEPEMKVAVDVEKLHRLIDGMKEAGVPKAQLCLVGWNCGGHDGRFPDHLPSDPRFGTPEELQAFIAKAQSYGYKVVCHTNSQMGFEIAKSFDFELTAHRKGYNGKPVPRIREGYVMGDGLSGGAPWFICCRKAYEKYAMDDLPKIRDYGFEGLHYIDELTAVPVFKCYHEEHPTDRTEALEWYRKIARLSTELYGGFQSEAGYDYMNADTDYVLYTSFDNRFPTPGTRGAQDFTAEYIPFWQLTYHGLVMSNASSTTCNHRIKGLSNRLHNIEYGARPMMYIHSKFGERKNWMGDLDLTAENEEAIQNCVRVIKETYDEYAALQALQYEFMEQHDKIGDKVYRVTYSDGTVMTVDYNTGEYTVEKDGQRKTYSV